MRIALVGEFAFPYGTASAARIQCLVKGLTGAGADLHVRAVFGGGVPRPEDAHPGGGFRFGGVPYDYWGLARPDQAGLGERMLVAYREQRHIYDQLVELIRREHIDLVYAYTDYAVDFLPIRRAARTTGVPVVNDVVEWMSATSWESGWLHHRAISHEWGMRFSNWKADGICGVSTYICRYYERGGMPVIRVPALTDLREAPAAPREARRNGPFLVGYYGTLSHKDGVLDMLKAIGFLLDRGRQVELLMAGAYGKPDSYRRRVQSFLDANPRIRDVIRFPGRVPQQELPAMFSECNALLLSRPLARFSMAGFPQKLPEYMTLARPVVVTAVGDIPEYVRDGVDGFVVPAGSPKRFADAIERIMDRPDRGLEMGASARRRAADVFDCHMHGHRLVAFFEQIRDRVRTQRSGSAQPQPS